MSEKLHSTDKALIDAARTGEGTVAITPEIGEQIEKSIREKLRAADEDLPKLAAECPYEMRLAVTAEVFKAIVEHARSQGSFRYLIYERLGFGPDAYVPLHNAGGMEISNEFQLSSEEDTDPEKSNQE